MTWCKNCGDFSEYCGRCYERDESAAFDDGYEHGAAAMAGLIGMAEAIRARGTDCVLCGKRTAFGGRVYQGGVGPVCGIDCLYDHGVR